MIQRIQSLYLTITLAFLFVVTFGTTLFSFQAPEFLYKMASFGVKKLDASGDQVEFRYIPFYYGGFVLILLCFFTLLVFKNLKLQLGLARFTTFLYFIVLVFLGFSAFLGTYYTKEDEVTVTIGSGFYLMLLGLPMLLLAIRGINKDRKLIDSVNRLR